MFSRGPSRGDKIRKSNITVAFSQAQRGAKLLCKPCVLWGPQKKGQNQNWLPQPRASRVSKGGRNCYTTPTFPGIPRQGDNSRIGYLTSAFSGSQRGWSGYVMPMSGSQQKGTKSEVATSSLPSQGPKTGAELLCNYCVVGVTPGKRDNIKIATSCLCSPGARRGRNRYPTLAFSGGASRGDKIRNSYITAAFSRAQIGAKLLRNPCVLGGPQKKGQNQKWLRHPGRLGCPKEAGTAT